MWYLSSENDPRVIYFTTERKQIILGRSVENCTFTVPEDASISRKHAVFSILDNNLILQDLGSRYGSFVNNSVDRIESDTQVKLNINDIVKFGKLTCVWKVCKIDFHTCTSTLKTENVQILNDNLKKIGGILKHEWDDSCAYLTMPAITLTIKVVLALMQGSHIVTLDFWAKCVEAVNNQISLPDPNDYIPQVAESTLNKDNVTFQPDVRRSTLFTGKKFVFFSRRQLEMYKAVVLKGSATPMLLSESQVTKSMLVDDDVIVIQYNPSNTSQETTAQRNQINDIVNYLKSKGKRVIADAEIGLAVLYCSVNKYCNTDFHYSAEVLKQSTCQKDIKTTNILACETQEAIKSNSKHENIVINESLTSADNITSSGCKRKFSEESDVNNVSKKIATDSILKNTLIHENNVGKRKLEESNAEMSNPSKKVATNSTKDVDDDFFNFITPVSCNNNENINSEKELNLCKPLNHKIKLVANDDEDDLFNFIEDKSNGNVIEQSKSNVLNMGKSDKQKQQDTGKDKVMTKINENIDISAMRGIKLKELMNNNQNVNADISNVPNIKKEVNDLDNIMSKLDIGSVVIKIRSDLIIKKEPVEIVESPSTMKNYKKFKKVWPVKVQTIL